MEVLAIPTPTNTQLLCHFLDKATESISTEIKSGFMQEWMNIKFLQILRGGDHFSQTGIIRVSSNATLTMEDIFNTSPH